MIARKKPAKRGRPTRAAETGVVAVVDEAILLADLRDLIKAARQRVARVANSTHTLLCWHVGRRLLRENLQDGRAAYRKRIVVTVSQQLTAELSEGFSLRSLDRFIPFSQLFPDEGIVSAPLTQFKPPRNLAEIDAILRVVTDRILAMIGGLSK